MATNKFLKFDESDTNMLDFAAYQANTMRTDGFPFGSKPPSDLTNRFYRDTAGFAYAFGEFMKAQGLDASPDDLAALISNIPIAISATAIAKGTNTSGTDAYIASISSVSAYIDQLYVILKATVPNIGACSLNINSLGMKSIKKFVTGLLVDTETGDILTNSSNVLIFSTSSDAWILTNAQSVVYESPFYVDDTWLSDFVYDTQNRLSTATYTWNAVTQKIFTYAYDTQSRINTVDVLVGAVTTTMQYAYDSQGRMTGRSIV